MNKNLFFLKCPECGDIYNLNVLYFNEDKTVYLCKECNLKFKSETEIIEEEVK